MKKFKTNFLTGDIFEENLAAFQESRRSIYGGWMIVGISGGVLGAVAFGPQLNSPWWVFAAYLAAVAATKKAFVKLARRVFPGFAWWNVTSVFLPTFLIACLPLAVQSLTSRAWIALPLIAIGSFIVGFVHTLFRIVFVRNHIAWAWAGAPCAAAAGVTGALLLRTVALSPQSIASLAIVGAIVGALYMLLTILLLEWMWDEAAHFAGLGTAYADKKENFAEAIALYDRAIGLKPNDAKLYAGRADVYVKGGDVSRAMVDIKKALALDSQCVKARLTCAALLTEAGDGDGAIAEYDEIIRRKPFDAVALVNRGRALSAKGEFERALADFNLSRGLGDDDAMTFAGRAEAYHKMGNYEQAISDCDRTLATGTMTPVAWAIAFLVRGKCYAAKGERERAASDFWEALQRTFSQPLISEAEECLRALESESSEPRDRPLSLPQP